MSKTTLDKSNIRLLICPVRMKYDKLLMGMVEDVLDQTLDARLDLHINSAMIGLTNERGLSILQNRVLTTTQKDRLMSSEKCMIQVFSSKFQTFPRTCALASALELQGKFEMCRLKDCPYCKKTDWI
ncbi:MAG: hypothetical protein GEU26_04665 [Nitrososphaeraceae archaeon]|nr:hypothetical protein [Nitrososphaeraceae archaeon]